MSKQGGDDGCGCAGCGGLIVLIVVINIVARYWVQILQVLGGLAVIVIVVAIVPPAVAGGGHAIVNYFRALRSEVRLERPWINKSSTGGAP